MSSIKEHNTSSVRAKSDTRIGIAVSKYNKEITEALLKSCKTELTQRGVEAEAIDIVYVPGAFELPLASQKFASSKKYHAVIALGCLIRGETPHFDCIAFAVTQSILDVGLKYEIPAIFGVLTTNTLEQAKDRIRGGAVGDKGVEAAQTALEMIDL